MKNFLIYFSGAVYSIKQCLLTWKKPKRYPIIIFIICFIMLLAPIQYNLISTPTSVIMNQIPNIEVVLKEVSKDLESKDIEVKIEGNKIISSKNYESYLEGFTVYINCNIKEYPEVKISEVSQTDNLIIFNETNFYARYVNRTELKIENGINIFSGNYSMSNSFTFDDIYEISNDEDKVKNVIGKFLKTIYLSNWAYNLLIWVFIIEMVNLFYLLLGSFLVMLFNNKGNRDYKLTYGQTFLSLMGSLILPTLVASIVGMLNFAYFTLTYIVIALIRLFMFCYAQLSKNPKYDQVENKVSDENFELNFK